MQMATFREKFFFTMAIFRQSLFGKKRFLTKKVPIFEKYFWKHCLNVMMRVNLW